MLSQMFVGDDASSMVPLVIAALYCVAFLAIAARRPVIALSIALGSAHFANDLGFGPIKIALGELNTCLLFLGLLLRRGAPSRFFDMGPLGIGVGLYLTVSVVATLGDLDATGIVALAQMAVYLVIAVLTFACYAGKTGDIRVAMEAFVAVGIVAALVVITGSAAFPQLVQHKNASGASLAAAFVVAIELWVASAPEPGSRRRMWLAGAVAIISIGLMFTLSRGGWLAAISGVLVLIVMRRQYQLVLKVGIVLIPLLAICWTYLPEDSREFATSFESGRENIKARLRFLETASERFQREPVLGTGVSFRKEADATNIIMSTLAETGVIGLGAFIVMHGTFVRLVRTAGKGLSPDDFSSSILRLAAALVIGRLAHGLVDHYWSRGTLVVAWATAGLALGIWRIRRDSVQQSQAARWRGRIHAKSSTEQGDDAAPFDPSELDRTLLPDAQAGK